MRLMMPLKAIQKIRGMWIRVQIDCRYRNHLWSDSNHYKLKPIQMRTPDVIRFSKETTMSNQMQIEFKVIDEDSRRPFSMQFLHTKHSIRRSAQRGIGNSKIAVALKYGDNFFKQGFIYYVLSQHNIPDFLKKDSKKLLNTVVVVSEKTNELVTCYRSINPFKHIKRKPKTLYKRQLVAA